MSKLKSKMSKLLASLREAKRARLASASVEAYPLLVGTGVKLSISNAQFSMKFQLANFQLQT